MGKSDEFSKVGAHTPPWRFGCFARILCHVTVYLLYYVDKWIDRFMVAFFVVVGYWTCICVV